MFGMYSQNYPQMIMNGPGTYIKPGCSRGVKTDEKVIIFNGIKGG